MTMDPLKDLYLRLPEGLRGADLIRRRKQYWIAAGIVFIHVPKAAGTSINQALYGRFMGHVRARDIRRWAPQSVKALPSFAVTRNPWDRLVSAWRFARRGEGIGGRLQAGVWRPQQYRIAEFETFERFVMQWLSARDVDRLDSIFQPQSRFVCDRTGRALVDHVGRLDDLGPTLDFLRARLGKAPAIPSSNRSGRIVDYHTLYTPELVDRVGRIYASDVEAFGYAFD